MPKKPPAPDTTPETKGEKKAPRGPGGRFLPGTVPNPKGRTPGSRHVALRALDAIGEANAEALVAKAVARALAGDMRAMEILLSRVWPARKGRPLNLTLPALTGTADLPAATAEIVAATARGDVTAEEAAALVTVLNAHRDALQLADLDVRLRRLEAEMNP